MAINLKSTNTLGADKLKMLVYGQAGSGKTSLIPTLPQPVIISAEAGLLSIAGADIPFVEVADIETLREAYQWAMESDEAKQFESIALDSISEIGEVVLSNEKARQKDPRAAYGEMQDQMGQLIRAFRDMPNKHVYFTAKLEKSQDEMGRMLYAPSMPGNKAGQALPYQFDIVAALRMERDAEGNMQRALMLESDGMWQAKDRSGKLDPWEAPDLGVLIKKIGGTQ